MPSFTGRRRSSSGSDLSGATCRTSSCTRPHQSARSWGLSRWRSGHDIAGHPLAALQVGRGHLPRQVLCLLRHRPLGTGIRVGAVLEAPHPLPLTDALGVSRPPQSFQYVCPDKAAGVLATRSCERPSQPDLAARDEAPPPASRLWSVVGGTVDRMAIEFRDGPTGAGRRWSAVRDVREVVEAVAAALAADPACDPVAVVADAMSCRKQVEEASGLRLRARAAFGRRSGSGPSSRGGG